MSSPIFVGTSAIVVAPINKKRSSIRFQNVSSHSIYLKKIPISGSYIVVSTTDYEIELAPNTGGGEGSIFETDSISSFMAVSSNAAGKMAIYETSKVNLKKY